MGILRITGVILLTLAGYSLSFAQEPGERQQVIAECVAHLDLEKFEQMERLVERYKVNQGKTTSTVSRLAVCTTGPQDGSASHSAQNPDHWQLVSQGPDWYVSSGQTWIHAGTLTASSLQSLRADLSSFPNTISTSRPISHVALSCLRQPQSAQ